MPDQVFMKLSPEAFVQASPEVLHVSDVYRRQILVSETFNFLTKFLLFFRISVSEDQLIAYSNSHKVYAMVNNKNII